MWYRLAILLGTLWVGSGLGVTARARPQHKPNIVLIVADDLGWRELGCYGQQKIETPHLDRLAAQGMRFTDFHSGAPVCAPSRCTLLTGLHSGHAVVRDNFEVRPSVFGDEFGGQYPLPAETVTIARWLKKHGYVTAAFGKWGLGGVGTSGDPLNQGFDRFFGYNCQRHAHNLYPRYLVDDRRQYWLEGNVGGLTGAQYAPQVINQKAIEWVRANRDRPFFLYYATPLPHLALQAPEEEVARYRGRWFETPYSGKSYLPNPTPRATYAAMVSFMDKEVGWLLHTLDSLGLSENTVVFFTSDNGTTHLKEQVDYEFFESVGPLRGLKGSLYEGGHRVPLIVRWPGKIPAGSVSDLVAANYDIFATICDIVGIALPAHIDGLSFLPTLLGKRRAQTLHDYLYWDFPGYGGQIAVRMGKWKALRTNLRQNPDAPLELYDLQADLSETRNLAELYPNIARRLDRIMFQGRTRPAEEKFQFWRYPD